MNGRNVIIHGGIFDDHGVYLIRRRAYTRQRMEKIGIAVYRLEMRDIVFLDPYGIGYFGFTVFE